MRCSRPGVWRGVSSFSSLGEGRGLTPGAGPSRLRSGRVFTPIHPVRLVDTHHLLGLSGKVKSGTPTVVRIAGEAGIPADATAVSGSVIVIRPGNGGWLLLADSVAEP